MSTRVELSVIAPCFNEEDNVPALVQRLLATFDKHRIAGEIVLVDDASRDATAESIARASAADARVKGERHPVNRGLFEGWRTGLARSTGDYVCLIDADLQNPPEEVARLWRVMRNEVTDIVQGTRSSFGRKRDIRYYQSRLLNFLLNRLFDTRAVDNKSGFVLMPRDILADVLAFKLKYAYPQTFIRISAETKGYSIRGVETLFDPRLVGKSFLADFSVRTNAAVLWDLIKGLREFRARFGPEDFIARYLRERPPQREPEPYTGWRRWLLELYFLLTPFHKWMITRQFRSLFFSLRRSQYLSRADLREFQLRRLRRMVRHAYNHVPFYRQSMDAAGVTPDDIRSLEDIARLPMLSKDDVRDNLYFDLFADNHRKSEMLKVATSGSTGHPFVCFADRQQLELRAATTMRAAEWAGWRFGDRQARLWHQTLGLTPSQVWREKIDAWFMRRLFIPAYEIRDDNIRDFLERLRRHRPVLIDGYAESFNFLAHYTARHDLPDFRPRAIMSSAQVMPDQVRHAIENRFGAAVFDKYGSREFSGIAYEDSGHDGHLVMAESYIVELIKDGRPAQPGEVGEVIVTDLTNMNMPMIRYRLGDLATALADDGPSASGRDFPRLGRIEGRAQAIIVCSNGTWLPSTFFNHYFKDYDHVLRQFQVIQERLGAITLKVVPGPQFSERTLGALLAGLRPFLGETMQIEVEQVEAIPLVRTGKRTCVVSRLNLDFQRLSEQIGSPADGNELTLR
jgi:phenylacetate-CoA ligase